MHTISSIFKPINSGTASHKRLKKKSQLQLRFIKATHIKNFIILIKLIFQNIFFNKFCGIFPIFFGDMATFAVEVWSWKLFQIKDPLVFAAAIRGSVNQNIVLRRVIKTARRRAQ